MKGITPEDLEPFLDDGAADRLRTYFTTGQYTGGRFERIAGGGDRLEVANRFSADDIVAVGLLSVQIPPRACLTILEQRGDEFGSLLSEVPPDVDLWDADESVVDESSPAAALWTELTEIQDVGWVTAGKLLARKRPRLIPVYDSVVRAALNRRQGDGWWLPLRAVLRDGTQVVERLDALRATAAVGDDISLLRVLDVSIWMAASQHLRDAP